MTDPMRARVSDAQSRINEIGQLMSTSEVLTDARRMQSLGREQATLVPIVEHGRALIEVERQLEDNQALLNEPDAELRALAEEEIRILEERRDQLSADLLELL